MFYKADALEMEINGFFSGYKYDISRTTDKGDVIYREEFLIPSATLLLDPAKAPLSIKVYDNAKAFPERKIFEDVYGVDMSKLKCCRRHGIQTADGLRLRPEAAVQNGTGRWVNLLAPASSWTTTTFPAATPSDSSRGPRRS